MHSRYHSGLNFPSRLQDGLRKVIFRPVRRAEKRYKLGKYLYVLIARNAAA
jgi:hypothetical protein